MAIEAAFHHDSLSQLLSTDSNPFRPSADAVPFQPFSRTSTAAQQDFVVLYSAVLLPLRPEALGASDALAGWLRAFVQQMVDLEDGEVREWRVEARLALITSWVNKRANG